LLLNLAQLLFATGAGIEARKRLAEAEKLGLGDDGALEAAFYRLAHVNQMTPAAWSTTI
jgi:hypothetical protein